MPSKTYVMVRNAPPEAGRVSNHARRQCNVFLAQPQFIASPTDNCVLLRQVRRRNRPGAVSPRRGNLRVQGSGLASDRLRRNAVLSFQQDAIGIRLRDVIGPDTMMWDSMLWGSDYPHGESTFPQSRKIPAGSWPGCGRRTGQACPGPRSGDRRRQHRPRVQF